MKLRNIACGLVAALAVASALQAGAQSRAAPAQPAPRPPLMSSPGSSAPMAPSPAVSESKGPPVGQPGGTAGYGGTGQDSASCASPSPERFNVLFAKYDTRKDGKLDRKQVAAMLREMCSE